MAGDFQYDVFLSHSAKDKAVVRPLAKRLREAGLRLCFGEWELPVAASRQSAAISAGGLPRELEDGGALPRRRYAEKIEEGLEHSRVLVLCMLAKDERHARYWMAQAFPVLLVIRDSEGEVRWMEVRDWLKRESDGGRKPVKQIVCAGERFEVMGVRRWWESVLGRALV